MQKYNMPDNSKVNSKLGAYQHISSNRMIHFVSCITSKGATAK